MKRQVLALTLSLITATGIALQTAQAGALPLAAPATELAQDGASRSLNSVAQDGADRSLNSVAQDGAARTLQSVADASDYNQNGALPNDLQPRQDVAQDGGDRHLNSVAQDGAERSLSSVA